MRPVPPEIRARITERLRENPDKSEVAREFGLNSNTIRKIAKRPDMGHYGHRVPPDVRRKVVERLHENPDAEAVATEFKLSKMTVCRYARAAKIPLKRAPDTVSKRNKEIIAARQAGGKPTQLARRFGISGVHVHKVLREAGVAPANPEVAERSRTNMQRMWADPLSPLNVGRFSAELERALEERNQELFRQKLRASSREMQFAVLRAARKFTAPRPS